MKKILIILFFVNASVYSQSGLDKLALEFGYKCKYTNNASFGLSYKLKEDHSGFFSGWTNANIAYLTNFDNEHYVMAGITASAILLEFGLNASTRMDIEPILGFNLGNYGRINFGYNIAFKQQNNFTFGIFFAIGLKKEKTYYISRF